MWWFMLSAPTPTNKNKFSLRLQCEFMCLVGENLLHHYGLRKYKYNIVYMTTVLNQASLCYFTDFTNATQI